MQASVAGDLFLSYHPGSGQFVREQDPNFILNGGHACDGRNAANMTHAQVLKQPSAYAWMQANPQSVVELTVHGNSRYESILMDRLTKLEQQQQQQQQL